MSLPKWMKSRRELEREIAVQATSKNAAYAERNKLVALISSLYPSQLQRHPEEDLDWEDDWRWLVFVELPTGQATWHLHDSDLQLFDHLRRDLPPKKWDGHSTERKYERVLDLIPIG